MDRKNIILCGFMGCGKSTVGKQLAKITGRNYVDMDICIEKKAGITVKEIFEQFGEDHFRNLEHEVTKELAQQSNLIVATGGGALLFDRNVKEFSKSGTIVLLDVPLGTIRYRLRNDKKRPLLQRPDKNKVMNKLYHERLPKYKAVADVTIKTRKLPLAVAKKIAEVLGIETLPPQ